MLLCSEPPSHPAWIVPTRLTGLTEFLPREAESVPAPPPRPARPCRHHHAHQLHATKSPAWTLGHVRYRRPGFAGGCLPACTLISPGPAPAQGRHQAASIHTQAEGLRLPEEQAQPTGRSHAEGQRQSWTLSRVGTALRGCSTPPRASVSITPEQCHRDTGVLG